MKDKTFIVAEVGINHNGNFQKSKDLILAARDSGADAVKWQTYQTDLRVKKDNPAYNILLQCEQTYSEQAKLKEYADKTGIEFFSTPFDEPSLKFLVESLGCDRVKVSSFDVSNLKLLRAISRLSQSMRLHVIMSVGMFKQNEFWKAVKCFKGWNTPLHLLYCISSYPTPIEKVNLLGINSLKELCASGYCCVESFGYSDHTSGVVVPAASVLMGAEIVEKHFTLDKDDGSPDNVVSVAPVEFRKMVDTIRQYELIMGSKYTDLGLKDIEKSALIFKRKSR